MNPFPTHVVEAAIAHAESVYPKEACGLMVGWNYVPCDNVAEDPHADFKISQDQIKKYVATMQGVIHSHPQGQIAPSEADMKGQIATNVPWGIVVLMPNKGAYARFTHWGDHSLAEPLIGRDSLPGVRDCFSLVRAYLYQKYNVTIPDFPRSDDWTTLDTMKIFWANRDAYPMLEKIDIEPGVDPEVGDIIVMTLLSPQPNHFGIVWEKNVILHQPMGGLSARRPIGTLSAKVNFILRLDEKLRGSPNVI